MSFNEKMTAIADTIRKCLSISYKLTLDDMPEHIDYIEFNRYYDGYENGWQSGWNEGYMEGEDFGMECGKQAEYDRFWDTLQDKGNRVNNSYLCCNSTWNDTIYNPKYPIKTNATAGNANYMFYRSAITNTKVPITINATNSTGVFYYATNLVTIPKLTVADGIKFTDWFTSCTSLKNVTFEGTISRTLNMQSCPLTVESILSVLTHLANYFGTDKEGSYTLTLSASCWQAIQEWASADYDTAEAYLPGYASYADVQDWLAYDRGWSVA